MHSEVLNEANNLSKIVTKFNLILTVFTAIGYCLVPIISNVYYHLIKGGPFLELMPTKTEFPYDISISPNYEFSYILICVAMFCIVFSSSGAIVENMYSKDLLLSIQIANKKSCINSGFFTASLPTFVTIINSAGSYITLLQSLADKTPIR
ncbi:unnamed protein product [Diamesa hyperborea]